MQVCFTRFSAAFQVSWAFILHRHILFLLWYDIYVLFFLL